MCPSIVSWMETGTRRSATDQFFSLSLITIPELFAKPIFSCFLSGKLRPYKLST